ncbi:MAG: (1-_4)-alpha-D-glucan 1-alpha-D-glucosylmutase, partial [Acidobacteriota bacterium]|nr:(1->4)-alpha-D-glucan 1-alpha-D-glucosylmutase [Acidobacteriota bacterium]
MVYRVPVATYRLQFNAHFTLQDARQIVPYLAELGITDLYSSPLLRPRKGSEHGYDIVDPTMLNPEIGNDDDFAAMRAELDRHGMGLVLDVVPNHMAASHENAWWMSVLENGAHSRYLHYFDIDWRPVAAHGRVEDKVLLPILGKPYGETLESKEIQIGFDADGLYFSYFDKRLPLAPQSYHIVLRECVEALPDEGAGSEVRDLVANDEVIANSRFLKDTLWRLHEQSEAFCQTLDRVLAKFNGEQGKPETFNELDHLLDAQWYRLAYWKIASETINYRRFFDVTDLVGLRIENPEVFETRNKRILEWIAAGKITGIRIDHIDGLFDPVNYLSKLQLRLGDPATEETEQFYVVVEKILAADESLPPQFRVAGTTGYDFLDIANTVFVDPRGLASLTEFYRAYTGITTEFEDLVYERKKQVIHDLFSGEMRALAMHLASLAVADRNARDFSPADLQVALLEVTACMPVYRTYVREAPVNDADRAILTRALAEARRRAGTAIEARVFTFVQEVLLLDPPVYIATERDTWLQFVMRWQQFTGRVMAKGVED